VRLQLQAMVRRSERLSPQAWQLAQKWWCLLWRVARKQEPAWQPVLGLVC
jgi:hypothetical protein